MLFRYHNARMISYDSQRGQNVSIHGNFSTLEIPQVSHPLDSGNYTCAPHNLRPSMITVHILGGKAPAAAEETAAAAVHNDDIPEAGGPVGDLSLASSAVNKLENVGNIFLWYLCMVCWSLFK